jgi:hypothetical protein
MKRNILITFGAPLFLAASAFGAMVASYDFESVVDNTSPTDDRTLNGGGSGGSIYDLVLPDFSPHSGVDDALTTGVSGPGSLGGNVLSPGTDGGYAVIDAGNGTEDTAFDGATGLTILGWYYGTPSNPVIGNGRIVDSTISGNVSGFFLRAETTMAARLRLGNGTAGANVDTPAGFFVSDSTWRFFAVTWDGSTGAVSFYSGTDTTAASNVHNGNNGLSTIGNFGAATTFPNLTLGVQGSNPSGAQFGAYLDNIQLYDTALDLTAIEAVRTAAVPEPSTFALVLGLGALGFILWRRRRG